MHLNDDSFDFELTLLAEVHSHKRAPKSAAFMPGTVCAFSRCRQKLEGNWESCSSAIPARAESGTMASISSLSDLVEQI